MSIASLMNILNLVGDKFPQVWPLIIQEVNILQQIVTKLHGQGALRMDTSKASTPEGTQAVRTLTSRHGISQEEATRVVATLEACHGHLAA
jgi:hypothetical protein